MRQETAVEREPVTGESPIAESSAAARVDIVLLTDGTSAVAAPVQAAYEHLTAAGHPVSEMASGDSVDPLSNAAPVVVLLYSGTHSTATKVCGEVKNACAGQPVVIGAVLPPGEEVEKRHAAVRRELRSAGADAVMSWHGSATELEAHVDLLAQILSLRLTLAGAREELADAARLDSTTRLLNRRSFFRAAQRECSRARRYHRTLACLMIGIDYFEHFDKTFGPACGDYVLCTVADALRESIRETDIAARFSDKKMAVLLTETGISGAGVTSEKLRQTIAATEFVWQGQLLPVSISVGEVERRWDKSNADGMSTPAGEEEDNAGEDDIVPVRLELAELLEEADVALSITRKGAPCPAIFIEDDLAAVESEQTPV